MSDYNKAELHLIGYLADKGCKLRESEVKDFDLEDDTEEGEIEGYANDYLSDLATEKAEYAASAQERYDEQHEWEIIQQEKYETFRNER